MPVFWNVVDKAEDGFMVILFDALLRLLPSLDLTERHFPSFEAARAAVKACFPEAVELDAVRFDDYF